MQYFVGPGLPIKSDCTYGRLYSRMSCLYKYKTSTLTPFVKPRNTLNLAVQNVFYVKMYAESAFTYNPELTQYFSGCSSMKFNKEGYQGFWQDLKLKRKANVARPTIPVLHCCIETQSCERICTIFALISCDMIK